VYDVWRKIQLRGSDAYAGAEQYNPHTMHRDKHRQTNTQTDLERYILLAQCQLV